MKRSALLLLLAAAAAEATPEADRAAGIALREYYVTLRTPTDPLDSVRNQLLPHMKNFSPKVGKSVRRVLNQGFAKKYKKDDAYHRCLAQLLANGGSPGIATLYRTYKSEKKRVGLRKIIAEELAQCGDLAVVSTLLKVMHDPEPEIAAVAIRGLAGYKRMKESNRKTAFKKLVAHYKKLASKAAGKTRDSKEMKMFLETRPAFNETLKAFSGGEDLDSAEAWEAWMRENITQPWPE